MSACRQGHFTKLFTGRAAHRINLTWLRHILPEACIHAGLRRFEGWLQEYIAWFESNCPFRPKPIKPFKGKTTTRANAGGGQGGTGLLFLDYWNRHPLYATDAQVSIERNPSRDSIRLPLGNPTNGSRHTTYRQRLHTPAEYVYLTYMHKRSNPCVMPPSTCEPCPSSVN